MSGGAPTRTSIGLVGCGRIVERGYLPALSLAPSVRLAAVADPVAARRAAVAPGVPGFPGAPELLAAVPVDALVVATPPHRHVEDARTAAAAGVPALVEKPPAVDAGAAAELAALDPPPWVGFNRRFEPRLAALREAWGGADALRVRLVFHYRRGAWAAHDGGADALLDVGPHLVDLARWLVGAEVERAAGERRGADGASIVLGLGSHEAAIELAGDRPYRELVEARDASGRRIGRFSRGGFVDGVRAQVGRSPSPLVPSLAAQLEALAAATSGLPTELATAADGLAAMRALEVLGRAPAIV